MRAGTEQRRLNEDGSGGAGRPQCGAGTSRWQQPLATAGSRHRAGTGRCSSPVWAPGTAPACCETQHNLQTRFKTPSNQEAKGRQQDLGNPD